jgi:NADPH:quinone reductase-like Zn-dependent oxidoreductase
MARILRFHQYGDPSALKIEDLDVPSPADEVQIEVKSIGLTRDHRARDIARDIARAERPRNRGSSSGRCSR